VKYLIVNADDFGASVGINRAVAELSDLGVLTSTSLMITMPGAIDAWRYARHRPQLGVGLHVTLTDEAANPLVSFDDSKRCRDAIEAQIDVFSMWFGRMPTHLDAHQNVHRDARLQPVFEEVAGCYDLPLREHSPVRYFSRFYGQWDSEPHPEHIGIDSLLQMLDVELHDGITELSCHPGYVSDDFESPYNAEREIELRTLSDPRLREFFHANGIELINFGGVHEDRRIAT
jgi:chitin disaccharide deacetylase